MSWVQWFDAAAATVSTSVKSAVDSAAVAVQNATSKIEEATRPVAAGAVASGEPEAKGEENKESAGEPMSGSGAPVDKEEQTSEKGLLQATSERWSSLVEKVWTSSETAGVASRPPPPDVGPGEPDKGVLLSLFDTVAKKIEATLKPEGSGDLLTAASGGAEGGAPLLPPWHVEGPQAEKMPVLKAQILNLSQEKWNFMQSPPEDILDGFHFSMSEMSPMAVECLKLDPQLEKMRWLLVPWKVKEEVFWRNYFAHIFTVRQAILYSRLEQEQIARASSPEVMGKRNLDELNTLLNDSKTEEVIELSSLSLDGLSLEEQINAALNDDI